jgi:enolase
MDKQKVANRIFIAPNKKGTFTRAAKAAGMSVQAFASHVLANPSRYTPLMRKKAQFAKNAKGFKH